MADRGVNEVFRRVYEATSRIIRELCGPFREALLRLKANTNGHEFGVEFDALVERVLFGPLDQPPLNAVSIEGGGDPRRALLHEMFLGLGVPPDTARRYSESLMQSRSMFDDRGQRLPITASTPMIGHWRALLNTWRPVVWRCASGTFVQLEQILRDASVPYRGRSEDPSAGIEQTVGLLRRFPDLADAVYREVGFARLRAFPPQRTAPAARADEPEAIFERSVAQYLEDNRVWEILSLVGLVVVSIALTVLTFGALGPTAAAIVGMGLGTSQGGVLVVRRAAAVSEGRVAVQVGAMDPATLAHLERELNGAWAALLIDVATGGLLGRFGGGSLVAAGLKAMAFSGVGSGLSAACDPNVWDHPDRIALILKGSLIGVAAGAGGVGIAAGTGAVLRPGSRIQLALDRLGGPLRPGRVVRVSSGPGDVPADLTVVRVIDDANVVVRFGNREVVVRIDEIVEIRRSASGTANPNALARATAALEVPVEELVGGALRVRFRLARNEVLIRYEVSEPGRVPMAPHPSGWFPAEAGRAHGMPGQPNATFMYMRREWNEMPGTAMDGHDPMGRFTGRWYQTTVADLLASYPGGRFVVDPANASATGVSAIIFVTMRSAPVLPLRTQPFVPGNTHLDRMRAGAR